MFDSMIMLRLILRRLKHLALKNPRQESLRLKSPVACLSLLEKPVLSLGISGYKLMGRAQ